MRRIHCKFVLKSREVFLDVLYRRRWEIPLDGVFLDGVRLPDTNLTGASSKLTALIDTVRVSRPAPSDTQTIICREIPSFEALKM